MFKVNYNELVLSDKVQEALPEMLEKLFRQAYRAESYFMLILTEDGELWIGEEISSSSTPYSVWEGKAIIVTSQHGFGPDRFEWDGEPDDEEKDECVHDELGTRWVDAAMNEIVNQAKQGWY